MRRAGASTGNRKRPALDGDALRNTYQIAPRQVSGLPTGVFSPSQANPVVFESTRAEAVIASALSVTVAGAAQALRLSRRQRRTCFPFHAWALRLSATSDKQNAAHHKRVRRVKQFSP